MDEAFVAGTAGPGVLLFMDAIGLRPQLEVMADVIASWGYVVLVPNVFWRDGVAADLAPTADLRVPENRQAFMAGAMQRVRALTAEQSDADTSLWLERLRRTRGVTHGPVAAVGYCFGGRLALRAAITHPKEFALVAMFHTGGLVTDDEASLHNELDGLRAFVLAGHADHDRSNTAEQVAAFDAALVAAGVEHRTAIYPGAAHGFTMADTASYDPAGAKRYQHELRQALSERLS